MRKVGKHALIVVVSAVLGAIGGFIGAVLTWPFWGWFEKTTGIESLGREGPDDWVFEFMIALAAVALFVWLEWTFREEKPHGEPASSG